MVLQLLRAGFAGYASIVNAGLFAIPNVKSWGVRLCSLYVGGRYTCSLSFSANRDHSGLGVHGWI